MDQRNNCKAVFILFILLWVSLSCNNGGGGETYIRLQQWDGRLQQYPEAIADSLRQLEPSRLSPANRAYFGLLKTIADDKTYVQFDSDSLISEVESYYAKHRPETDEHIRSLTYQSIVRYRMGVTDSTVLIPLKEAEKIFYRQPDRNISTGFMVNTYLGAIHDKNRNFTIATEYRQKALQYAKEKKTPAVHIFDSYLALFWNSMKLDSLDRGKAYLDTLEAISPRSADEEYFLLNAQSVYYTTQELYDKALDKEKEQVKLAPFIKEKTDIFRTYYSISEQYHYLGQLDSAMHYALKSIDHISDSGYVLNYLLYENVADIAEKQHDFKIANDYRREAALVHKNTLVKQRDMHILQLEKRYDLTEAENKALRAEAGIRIAIITILCLVLLLAFSFIYIQKRRNRAKIERMEMEEERRKNKQQQFTMKLYQQLLSQFFLVEKELGDLANKERVAKPDFADFVEELQRSMAKSLIESFTRDISGKKIEDLTGICLPDGISKSELLMFFLIYCGAANSDIAVIFKTSKESIRSRKSQLKSKLVECGIDISFFDQPKIPHFMTERV